MRTLLVPKGHALREPVQAFIARVYEENYAARIDVFAPTLIAMVDEGQICCAASLRFAVDGFFSEAYLDTPIELSLLYTGEPPVRRDKIFEVGSLSSRAPKLAPRFIRQLIRAGERAGFDCAIFTATERLRRMLTRIGLPLLALAPADASRVAAAEMWGTYYATRPHVLAVTREQFGAFPQTERHEHNHV